MDDKNMSPKKRYTQHYRKKWEDIPQLRGWLSMFPHKNPEKTKAFCKYCQRKLVPHVTGLLKHAACRAHLKAAKTYMDRIREGIKRAEQKAKSQTVLKQSGSSKPKVIIPTKDDIITEGEDGIPKITVLVRDPDDENEDNNLEAIGVDEEDLDEEDQMSESEDHVTVIPDPMSQVKIRVLMDDSMMSTNVVDTTKGMPVIGLGVSLYHLKEGRWTLLSDSVTDAEGRCSDLLKDNSIALSAGRYKMHYDVSQYYAIRNQECFFPFIEIVFDLGNPQEKCHIPLLLSPYSYSTYKSS